MTPALKYLVKTLGHLAEVTSTVGKSRGGDSKGNSSAAMESEIQYFEINDHVVAHSNPLENECKGSKPIEEFTGCLKTKEYDFSR